VNWAAAKFAAVAVGPGIYSMRTVLNAKLARRRIFTVGIFPFTLAARDVECSREITTNAVHDSTETSERAEQNAKRLRIVAGRMKQ
jgi:hypothetical protein